MILDSLAMMGPSGIFSMACADDARGLPHLFHANHVPIVGVARFAGGNIEFEIGVDRIGLRFAKIPLHAGAAQRRSGQADVDGILRRDRADAASAADPDAVFRQQRFVLVRPSSESP